MVTEASGLMSPANWPAEDRDAAERTEAQRWTPETARLVQGENGLISTTVSSIALQAGLQALRLGGSAADAAAAVALTQITTQLGSIVSYAGILSLLYYEARTGRVHSLDAGYNSYKAETDPKTIPVSDSGRIEPGWVSPLGDSGRKTLVPGFFAGVQAMHDRFGKLPFPSLFEPALWYARRGVTISPILRAYFVMREACLRKTAEGCDFLRQSGRERPELGDSFVQSALADTLQAVAEQGASAFYEGPWAEAFVSTVRAAGGKATLDDLKAYEVIWSEPHAEAVFGHTVYLNGPPNRSVHSLMTGLRMAEALGLDSRGPCWSDPAAFRDLSRICPFAAGAPLFSPVVIERLLERGIDVSLDARGTRAFAQSAAAILDQVFAPTSPDEPRHSNAIVVVDRNGDIAVMTHTINAMVWGDTGLVVGGIPLPDSAGFQQWRLTQLPPGARMPNEIACTLTFAGDKPVLATAPVGRSLFPETLKTIVSVIGQGQPLAETIAAPPMLLYSGTAIPATTPLIERPVGVPAGAYEAAFLAEVGALGVCVAETPTDTAASLRGTLACVSLDPETGLASSPEVPGVLVFGGAV